jgi:TfoX/Sxy family transcriptional regulator of competence genes
MAYDEDLANRLREQVAAEEGVSEKAMFGGLAFLLHGNMAVTVSSRGGLMVRVGREAYEDALARPHTKLIEMRGRPMPGWIHVAAEGVKTKRQLGAWVRRGVQFTRTLAPKGSR